MLIPPKYELTKEVVELLQSIEASKEVIDSITIPPKVEQNIRRQSTLKSSLFSARIEGNPLTLEDLSSTSDQQKKAEVFNTLKALNWLKRQRKKDISLTEIKELHKIVMDGLVGRSNWGIFRKESSATFNQAGIAIYLHPTPHRIQSLMKKFIKYTNSDKEKFTPIKAVMAHYSFEKIHPFLDGNGRVGRLLIQRIMFKEGYGMKGLLNIEEYIDNHRTDYYSALEEPEKNATDYLIFMLEAIAYSALQTKEMVLQKKQFEAEDYLLPRRAEIFNIIKDQKLVNMDQLQRRFAKINPRTLRYDLKKLQDEGLIIKLGSTKGVYYKPKND